MLMFWLSKESSSRWSLSVSKGSSLVAADAALCVLLASSSPLLEFEDSLPPRLCLLLKPLKPTAEVTRCRRRPGALRKPLNDAMPASSEKKVWEEKIVDFALTLIHSAAAASPVKF